MILALGKQRQVDLCEFKASLVYKVSSRTAKATWRNLKTRNKQTNKHTKKIKKTHTLFCFHLVAVF